MTIDLERFQQIQPALKAWFPPEAHKERDLPGGGTWWYVSWMLIRERLDEVVPDWQIDFTDPVYIEDLCVIRCRITICGIVREGVGNAPIRLISRSGKDMARGTAVERAVADAFKACCEGFGICRYLDDQVDEKTKKDFIRYMHKGGNGRAVQIYRNNEAIANGQEPKKPASPAPKPFGGSAAPLSGIISEAQRKRFYTIAKNAGYTDPGAKKLLAAYGFESSRAITQDKYEELCRKAQDKDLVAIYNQQAVATW